MAREMKDSGIPWIGTIPSDWEVRVIKNVLQRRNQKNNPIISEERLSLSIDIGITKYAEKTTNLDRFKDDFTQYQLAYPDDIVLNSMNMIVGAVGKSNYFGCVSPVYYVMKPKNSTESSYYAYVLNTTAIRQVYHSLGKGIYAIERGEGRVNTCRLKVAFDDFGRIGIPVPPLATQQRIADFLNRKCAEIDELAALQETMIEELKHYKQSLITEIVTKGLDPNAKMKDSGVEWIGKIPEGWDVRKLKRFGYLYGGLSGKSGDDFNVDEETDNYALYVPFTNIFNNTVINPNILHKVKVNAGENQNEVHCGDILFLMSSEDYEGVGKSALVNCVIDKLYLNSFCKGLRITSERIHSPYLNYLLLSTPIRNHIMVMANGFIRINLRAEKLGTLTILIPPLTEQQQIADYLDRKCAEIDELIAIKQQKIEALKEYKKSVIFEYVTGKKEII